MKSSPSHLVHTSYTRKLSSGSRCHQKPISIPDGSMPPEFERHSPPSNRKACRGKGVTILSRFNFSSQSASYKSPSAVSGYFSTEKGTKEPRVASDLVRGLPIIFASPVSLQTTPKSNATLLPPPDWIALPQTLAVALFASQAAQSGQQHYASQFYS
jgi:hypothetical protein